MEQGLRLQGWLPPIRGCIQGTALGAPEPPSAEVFLLSLVTAFSFWQGWRRAFSRSPFSLHAVLQWELAISCIIYLGHLRVVTSRKVLAYVGLSALMKGVESPELLAPVETCPVTATVPPCCMAPHGLCTVL